MRGFRSEEGFTLVEVLGVLVILGLIIGPLTASLIVGLRITTDTKDRLFVSHDAQIAAAYLTTDVQSADVVLKGNATAIDENHSCVSNSITPLVSMAWTDDTGLTDDEGNSIDAKLASYYVATANGERRLIRRYCEGSTAVDDEGDELPTVYNLRSEVTVAHALSPTGPTVTCVPSVCDDAAVNTLAPDWVSIALQGCILDTSGSTCKPEAVYDYTLSATRRSGSA